MDKNLIKKYCHDADIVHQLLRITSVPRVISRTKSEQEKLMEEAEVVGMQNILDVINDKCKILLHSPHIVHDSLR